MRNRIGGLYSMKKKSRKGWIWLVVIAVVLAGGFALSRVLQPGTGGSAQQYEAVKAAKQDMRVTVHGTGSIAAMDSKTVSAEASGKVSALNVKNGDAVKKGDVIATLDAKALNDTIASLKEQIIAQDATVASLRATPTVKYLYAPVDARVKAIYAKTDEDAAVSMSAKNALMLLSTDGKMKVEFVPAAGASVAAGGAVKLTIGGKTVNGFVTTVPDSTTDKATAVVAGDTYALNADAVVKDTKGNELGRRKLEPNKPLLVTAYSGTVDHIYVKNGAEVRKGRKLIRLSGDILDANFNTQLEKRQQLQDDLDEAVADLRDYTITTPEDGIVTNLAIEENGTVQDGMAVCTVEQTSGFKLVVAVDELDVPGILLGQKADVKIDALPGVTAQAQVAEISPIGVKANDVTTYDVTLAVSAPAGTLVNMSASADIEVAFKPDALTVPVEALHTVNGKTFVYAALPDDIRYDAASGQASGQQGNGGGMARRFMSMFGNGNSSGGETKQQRQTIEVTVGLISDSSAEILNGLNEGDEVAVPVVQDSLGSMFGFSQGGNQNTGSEGRPAATGQSSN
jgi:HlyD family secretion protein